MFDVGIDLGGHSLECVVLDEQGGRVYASSRLVKGEPLERLRESFAELAMQFASEAIHSVGVTGSGWRLVKATVGAVYVGEEMALLHDQCAKKYPRADSLVKIGYEETAFCHLHEPLKRRGKKNECIRNLGAFYVQQLERFGVANEQDLMRSDAPEGLEVQFSAKCPAFILRDMLKFEQMGLPRDFLGERMAEALVRCYLQNTAKDERFDGDIVLTGLLAESAWAVQALARLTGQNVHTSAEDRFMAAEAAAIRAQGSAGEAKQAWRSTGLGNDQYSYAQAYCEDGCGKHCSLVRFIVNGHVQAVWGGKCDRWDNFIPEQD